MLVGEVWLADADRFARYLRPDELHTAFNFDFLRLPVGRRPSCARRSTRRWPRTHRSARRPPGCCPTTTSPGRSPATAARTPRSPSRPSAFGIPTDLALGHRRARAAALLAMALPGLALHLPGRGARAARGRGHPGRPAAGPDVLSAPAASTPAATAAACRCRGPESGATVRLQRRAPATPWLPQPAGLGRRSRSRPGGRPGVDADALPRRPAAAPRRPADRRRRVRLARRARERCSASAAASDFVCLVNFGRPSTPGRACVRTRATSS